MHLSEPVVLSGDGGGELMEARATKEDLEEAAAVLISHLEGQNFPPGGKAAYRFSVPRGSGEPMMQCGVAMEIEYFPMFPLSEDSS